MSPRDPDSPAAAHVARVHGRADAARGKLDAYRAEREKAGGASDPIAQCRAVGERLLAEEAQSIATTDDANGADESQLNAETTDGAQLLADVEKFLGRFVIYPTGHARVAHVLWIAHAHLMDCWESTPRIAFLSPEPASGKTRALEITELLVPRPIEAINTSAAYLFRKVSDSEGPPTILYDEIDTLFGPKAKENEEIRGILNAGHRRGAVAGRCVVRGKTIETEELPAYCAVALAGLGRLPDSILTRSVVVRMRRRAPMEKVEPYRRRHHKEDGYKLRERLAIWAGTAESQLKTDPPMPEGVADRAADVWEALLAVADAAGGAWPKNARSAAVALVTAARESPVSLGLRLLADLRQVFGERDAMFTEDVLSALIALKESPWGNIHGSPLDSRRLAWLLGDYEIGPKTVRIGEHTRRGYTREDLHDAWTRYVPPAPQGAGSTTCATCATGAIPPSGNVADAGQLSATASATKIAGDSALVADVAHVADSGDCRAAAENGPSDKDGAATYQERL